MPRDPLAAPDSQQDVNELIGPQGENKILRMLGVTVLSMVAIHFGSYALKNAGVKLLEKYGSEIALTASRTTSIAEDILGLGKKLDQYSVKRLGLITDTTPLGKEFALRAQARAAQQAKRFPFEFIPAYLVQSTMQPKTQSDDQGGYRLKTMGQTVLNYAAADILFGAAAPLLAKTQAATYAKESLKKVGPDALKWISGSLNEPIIRGSGGAKAIGAMYREWESRPSITRVPSASNYRSIWKEGVGVYKAETATLRAKTNEAALPSMFKTLRRTAESQKAVGAEGAKYAYGEDWVNNLAHEAGLLPYQAESIYHVINIGQDSREAFRAIGFLGKVADKNANWYSRFGHTEKTFKVNFGQIQKLVERIPQLKNKTEDELNKIFQSVTERTDRVTRSTWIGPPRPGQQATAGYTNRVKGGILHEQEMQQTYDYLLETLGEVDPSRTNFLGVRRMSWEDYGKFVNSTLGSRGGGKLAVKFNEIDDMVASYSIGGRGGEFYKKWSKLAVDKNLFVKGGTDEFTIGTMIDFNLPKAKAYDFLGLLERSTQIPVLHFNPLQLLHWRSRMAAPEGRWIPTGSNQPSLGGIVMRPTFQIGDRIAQWEGSRVGNLAYGSLVLRPERFVGYETTASKLSGRIVRNILGLGDDRIREFPDEKPRWWYGGPRRSRIAKAFDISEYTTGGIKTTASNWFKGAPSWTLSRVLKDRLPRTAERLRKNVPPTYFARELPDLLAMGEGATPEQITSVLEQASAMFHPAFPVSVLNQVEKWLPFEYNRAGFYRAGAGGGRVGIPNVNTVSLIDDVVKGKEELLNIIGLLEQDARIWGKQGGSTLSLFNSLLRNDKHTLINTPRAISTGLAPSEVTVGQYAQVDKIKRNIVSYLLARPTTIPDEAASSSAAVKMLMQVTDLDRLSERIGIIGKQGKAIESQISGAIAALKLVSYKAVYAGNIRSRMAAIARDQRIVGEMNERVTSWAKFPFGKSWRSQAPDPRNAVVTLNRFADDYVYLEKFGSAWKRDPAAAVQGIFGAGGTKTGMSYGAYHLVNRLRGVLKLIGLDFKEGAYTNPVDMLVGGFMFRRILPAMALVEMYRYIDWKISEWGGDKQTGGLTAQAIKWGVVQPSVAAAAVGQKLGIQRAAKWFGEVTGEEDRMNALKYLRMGPQEMKAFWEQGEVPVRRGRWWILSPTPFKGQRTQFFIPNIYRRAKSRYQYTWEGGKGPEEFAFAHSWIPTPEYPLAPITRLFDPYAFEKATYNTRPYPLTGDFFTGPYGPISPILNATIGQLIKPTKRMHAEEMANALQTGTTPFGGPLEGVRWPQPAGGVGTGTGSRLVHAQIANANSRVVGQALTGSATVGQPYGIGTDATMVLMGSVGVAPSALVASTPPGIWTTPSAIGNMKDTAYRIQEMAGIYGFGVQAVRTRLGLSPEYAATSYLPKASEAYSFQQRFWGMQLGGMGDFALPGGSDLSNITFSEIFRRFVPRQPTGTKVNPIPNAIWQQNQWLPGPYSNYFKDFSMGDPYASSYAPFMLPGEAYQRAYGTTPNAEKGMVPYGPIDRLRMLSKVAPWSLEYKALNKSLARMNMSPAEEEQYQIIRAQVEAVNKKYDFAPYRFKGMELEDKSYNIVGVTQEGYLQARGLGTPIKLAGLTPGPELAEALRSKIGTRMDLQIDVNRPRFTYENEQKVLEAVAGGLNKDLLGQGLPEEIGGSPLSYYARNNRLERAIGSAWESITHTWNPITTKFIQRRTALEEYERTNVFGLDYAPWTHPYSSFIRPQLESAGAKSWAGSVITGGAVGVMVGKGTMAKTILGVAGGLLGALNKLRISATAGVTGETWVPKHVRKRWEQEEYMDVLQYTAAAKNYSLYRQRALAAGERDPESLWQADQTNQAWLAQQKRNISASILERSIYGGVSKKEYLAENPIGAQALAWREKMGQTLYGANLTGDYLSLQQAIPKERRMYFEQFLNAPKSDQERILSLLPPMERRLYQSAWGLPVDPKPSLNDYFEDHYLPSPDAVIWNTNVDWDKTKVRMIEKAGENPSQYGYYPQEVQAAELYPIPVPSPNMQQIQDVKSMLEQILGASQIEGLSISVQPSAEPGFNMDFDITRNMRPLYNAMIGNSLESM